MNLFQPLSRQSNLVNLERLKKHGVSDTTIAKLRDFVRSAKDRELYRANPRYWAERLELEERATLELIVVGVVEGLFDLTWQTACPICKIYDKAAASLDQVTQLHRCENCNHDFEANLDEGLFVTVSVNDSLRRLTAADRDDPIFHDWVNAHQGLVSALTFTTIPAFQEFLAYQSLAEGQSLGIKNLAIFFSDLRSSTALYHQVGDAEAYRRVSEHFKVLFEAAAKHNGTAVKTIGDGVMGIFAGPKDALAAIADSLTGMAALNQQLGLQGEERLMLKVGLHVGPCIVVTLNKRLDYFGETVNIASRLSGVAQGDDVILSHDVLEDPSNCAFAKSLGQLTSLTAKLNGLPQDFDLHRLMIA